MLNEIKRDPYSCLTSFSHLNGWQKQEIFIGTRQDARTGRLVDNTSVAHHYRTHRPSRFKGGYIILENGKRFDVLNQTINGKPRYIFPRTPEIDILWRRQVATDIVKGFIAMAPVADVAVVVEIILECARLIALLPHSRRIREERAVSVLGALSVCRLEDLAALIGTSAAAQDPPKPQCAA